MDARGLGAAAVVDADFEAVRLLVRHRVRHRRQGNHETGEFADAFRALTARLRPAVAEPPRRGTTGVEHVGTAQLQLGHFAQAPALVVEPPAGHEGPVDGRCRPRCKVPRGVAIAAADGRHEIHRTEFGADRQPLRARPRQLPERIAIGMDQGMGGLLEIARLGQHARREAGGKVHVRRRQQRIGVLLGPCHVGNGPRDRRQVVQRGLVRMRLDDQQIDALRQLAQRRDDAGGVHGAPAADQRQVDQALPENKADAKPRVEQGRRTVPREVALERRRMVPEQFLVDAAGPQRGLDDRVVRAGAEVQVLGEAPRIDLDVEVARAAAGDAVLQRGREAPADHQAAGIEGRHTVAAVHGHQVGDAGAGPAGRRARQVEPGHDARHVDPAAFGERRHFKHRQAQAAQCGFEEAPQESPVRGVVRKTIGGGTKEIVRKDNVIEPADCHRLSAARPALCKPSARPSMCDAPI